MVQEVWAGVARVTITPPVGSTWQGGYAARERPVQGIHDELVATALVLANGPGDVAGRVALVAADILNLSAEQVLTFAAGTYVTQPNKVHNRVAAGTFGWTADRQSIVLFDANARRYFADIRDGNLL